MSKLDNNKKEKFESLLNTAFNMFTTKGINKTSISDITNDAGVAKGTFYLYFKDKYDIRNKLISHKSSIIFMNSVKALEESNKNPNFEEKIIFLIDNIINQLKENQALLNLISKNLSWGIFKTALTNPYRSEDINFRDVYNKMLAEAPNKFDNPEIMLFMIVELVSSTIYSSILYKEPVELEELKPYIYRTVRAIIREHTIL